MNGEAPIREAGLPTVAELRRCLADDLDRYRKSEAPRDLVPLRQTFEHAPPLWVDADQQQYLEHLDQAGLLMLRKPKAGEAAGVVIDPGMHQGYLVWLRLARKQPAADGSSAPTTSALAATSVDAIRYAVSLSALLYPHHTPLDPTTEIAIELCDARGQPVDRADTIQGSSLGLSALCAAWSLLAAQPLPSDLVATGALARSGALPAACCPVLPVHHLSDKRREVSAADARLLEPKDGGALAHRTPAHNPPPSASGGSSSRQLLCSTAGEALLHAFGLSSPEMLTDPERWPAPVNLDVHHALEALDRAYWQEGGGLRWPELASQFIHLAQNDALQEARALAWARAGACLTHIGHYSRALELLHRALDLGATALSAKDEVETRTHLASCERDRYRFAEGAREARNAWELGERFRVPKSAINARSTLGLLLMAGGDPAGGLPHLEAARDYYASRRSSESPRNHTYVVACLGRLGRLERARAEACRGRRANETVALPTQRRLNRAYLDHAMLSSELLAYRRDPPSITQWQTLAERAESTAEGFLRWPGAGLRRVAWAARAWAAPQCAPALLSAINEEIDQARSWKSPIELWQTALSSVEVVLALTATSREGSPNATKALQSALEALPPAARQQRHFDNELENLQRKTNASTLRALLEREPY